MIRMQITIRLRPEDREALQKLAEAVGYQGINGPSRFVRYLIMENLRLLNGGLKSDELWDRIRRAQRAITKQELKAMLSAYKGEIK